MGKQVGRRFGQSITEIFFSTKLAGNFKGATMRELVGSPKGRLCSTDKKKKRKERRKTIGENASYQSLTQNYNPHFC